MPPYVRVVNSDWRRTKWVENLDAADPYVRLCIKEIKEVYDDDISVDKKRSSLLKFGQTATAGGETQVTVMTLGAGETSEDYVSANSITHVASSSTAVEGVATVVGHTISGNDLTYVSQTVTLAGQTKTALTTPLARASRIVNNSTLDWASNVYVARNVTFTNGIPQDSSAIHLIGIAADNQSQKAAHAFASDEYALITQIYGSIAKNQGVSASADIRLKIRPPGEVFQTKWVGTVDLGANVFTEFRPQPYLVAPKNSDVLITAESSGTNVAISAGFSAILGEVV